MRYDLGAGGTNLTGEHIRIWFNTIAQTYLQNTANHGIGVYVEDTSGNWSAWTVGGSDTYPGGWIYIVQDLAATASRNGGTAANLASARYIGLIIVHTGIAPNKTNTWVDALSYGQGLRLTGGTAGTPLGFSEFFTDATNGEDAMKWGVLQESNGVYFLTGKLVFGDDTGTGATYFEDTDKILIAIDEPISTTLAEVRVVGNSTGVTSFQLGTKVGTGDTARGRQGCIIKGQTATQPGFRFDADDANVEYVLIYGSIIQNADQGIVFSADATNGPNHELAGTTIDSCDQAEVGRVVIRNCTFSGYSGTESALLWNANINIKNSNFIANTDASNDPAGIEHAAAGTFSYDGLVFSGNDWDVLNSVSATITDSYSESNYDSDLALNGTNNAAGQEITGDGNVLSRARFYLQRVGTLTGNVVAKVYASDLGSPAAPTGAVLATSETVAASGLSTSYALVDFEFEDEFTLVNTTKYFIVVEYTSGDGSNYINVGYDNSTPGHGGNGAVYTTSWTGQTYDFCFYVHTGAIVKINASNGANPGTAVETGTNKGATIISNPITYTLTGIESGSEVRIYDQIGPGDFDAGEELDGEENNTTGTFAYQYNYASDNDVVVVVFHVNYKEIRFKDTLTNQNKSTQVFQIDDTRVYSNP
jgi:hypothetical protein